MTKTWLATTDSNRLSSWVGKSTRELPTASLPQAASKPNGNTTTCKEVLLTESVMLSESGAGWQPWRNSGACTPRQASTAESVRVVCKCTYARFGGNQLITG